MNVSLKKDERDEVKRLLSRYIYLTSEDVERDEEGFQYYEDAKEYVADVCAISWHEAKVVVSELLKELRKEEA